MKALHLTLIKIKKLTLLEVNNRILATSFAKEDHISHDLKVNKSLTNDVNRDSQ